MADHASPHSVATHATALLSGEEASAGAEGGAKPLCRYSPHDAVQVDCAAPDIAFQVAVEAAGAACALVKVKLQAGSHYRVKPHLFVVAPGAPGGARAYVPERERYLAAVAAAGGRHRSSMMFQELEVGAEEAAGVAAAAAAAAAGGEAGSSSALKARLAELWKRAEGARAPSRSFFLYADAAPPPELLPQLAPQLAPQPHAATPGERLHAAGAGAAAAARAAPDSVSGAGKDARRSTSSSSSSSSSSLAALQEQYAELVRALHREREENNHATHRILEADAVITQISKANKEWIPQRERLLRENEDLRRRLETQRDFGIGGGAPQPQQARRRAGKGAAGGEGGEEEEEDEAGARGSGRGFACELWHLLLMVFLAVLVGRISVQGVV